MSGAWKRPWTLGGRLSRLFLWSTLLFVLVISAISAVALDREIEYTIDARGEEEAEEMRAQFEEREFERTKFLEQAVELNARHQRLPMAWRAWSPRDGVLLAETGPQSLLDLAHFPANPRVQSCVRLDDGLRSCCVPLPDGTVLMLVLDGSYEYHSLWHFARWVGGATLVCAAGALFVSSWFSRRVSRILKTVAERARTARPEDAPDSIDVEGAPEEIRAVTDALHEMLARIRTESEAQRVYLAGMAHELRAPLQNLVGETEVALRKPRDAQAYHDVLASHLEELRALGDAIDNLVAISSNGAARTSGASEDFDMGEEARIRLVRERAAAEREDVEVALDVRGTTLVRGDREALLRALRNLVQNAVQWSPRGGRVDVAIAGGASDLEFVVDDAGPGVPDDLRQTIFEPFVRGPSARGRRIGYGLGLALVKRAADEQGGAVHVERSPHGGARFRVKIPRRR